MKIGFEISRSQVETRSSIEDPTVAVSQTSEFMAFFGLDSVNLPHVTIDNALTVPAVSAAVAFLSRTMATLPLHAYRNTRDGAVRVSGKLQVVVHDAPNDGMDSFKFRQYFWQQVFTVGRGLAWIERTPQGIEALWPMDPNRTQIKRVGGRLQYKFGDKLYDQVDVIDVPFMLRADGVRHYGPISMAAKAIQLALAMNEYGSKLFAGGGVPPLALVGPLPVGADAMKRAMADIGRAIDVARQNGKPIIPIPPGYELKPIGFDPEKGQMTEARTHQIQEIARIYQLPPVFLQDLSRATFTNAEQQDLHLVKHLVGQWSEAFEGELNLKLFGRFNAGRYVEHNLDGLMRGDFKSRIEGIARAVQTAQITPNEARALENRPRHANPAADELLVQGATIVLGQQPVMKPNAPDESNPVDEPKGDGEVDDNEA